MLVSKYFQSLIFIGLVCMTSTVFAKPISTTVTNESKYNIKINDTSGTIATIEGKKGETTYKYFTANTHNLPLEIKVISANSKTAKVTSAKCLYDGDIPSIQFFISNTSIKCLNPKDKYILKIIIRENGDIFQDN